MVKNQDPESGFGHRRTSKRMSCFLVGGYVMLDKAPYVAKYCDISLDGIGVITEQPLPVGTHVRVALNTKKKGLMLVDGKICWCKNPGKNWRSGVVFDRKLSVELATII